MAIRRQSARVGIGIGIGTAVLCLAAPADTATLDWLSLGSVSMVTEGQAGDGSVLPVPAGFLLAGDAVTLVFGWDGTQVAGDGSVRPADGVGVFGDGSVAPSPFAFATPLGRFGPMRGTELTIRGGDLAGLSFFRSFASVLCDGSVMPADGSVRPQFVIEADGSVLPGDGSVVPGAVRLADGSVRQCDGSVRPAEVAFAFNPGVEWLFGEIRDGDLGRVLATGSLSASLVPAIPLPPALPLSATALAGLAVLGRRRR